MTGKAAGNSETVATKKKKDPVLTLRSPEGDIYETTDRQEANRLVRGFRYEYTN